MSEIKLDVRDGLYLSSIDDGDQEALLEHLSTRDVYNTTLNIPFPYTEVDAHFWIRKRKEIARTQGIETTFALRDHDGWMIGIVGADDLQAPLVQSGGTMSNTNDVPTFRLHRAEIGYWLAPKYWGRGIMTDAVRVYVRFAFESFELARLTAHVFARNRASSRVLEKNGFTLEGRLRQHFRKDGELLDAFVYGLLRDEFFRSVRFLGRS